MKKKIAVLVSGSGTNLQRILDACNSGEIRNAEVSMVVTDRPCFGLQRAADAGVRQMLIPRGKNFSAQLASALPNDVDLIVLAGFLSILDADFCAAHPDKIINIHPALLPSYGGKGMWGMRVHDAVIAAGEKESGATVHYVTAGIDEGAIILQQSVAISQEETAETLASKVHEVEYEILPKAIDILLNDRQTES